MSALKIKLVDSTIEFLQEDLRHDYIDIMTFLDTEGAGLQLKGIQHIIVLKNGDDVHAEIKFPADGVKFIRSDQPLLNTNRVGLSPDMVLDVNVSVSGTEGTHQFTVPRPPKPSDGDYEWNAEELKWDEVQ